MLHKLLIAGSTALFLSSTAIAQQAWVEIPDDTMVTAFSLTADQVDDLDVYDTAGREIGDVEDVIGPDRDTPTALTVDFEGDAGFPDRDDVIIPIERFTLENNRLILDIDPAEVAGLPVYND